MASLLDSGTWRECRNFQLHVVNCQPDQVHNQRGKIIVSVYVYHKLRLIGSEVN